MLEGLARIVYVEPGIEERCGPQLNELLDGSHFASVESTSPVPAKAGPLLFLLPDLESALLPSPNVHRGHATRTPVAVRVRVAPQTAEDAFEVRSSDTRLQDLVRNLPNDLTSNISDLPQMVHRATRAAAVAVSAIACAHNSQQSRSAMSTFGPDP